MDGNKSTQPSNEVSQMNKTQKLKFECHAGSACFVAGTLVDTATGLKPIEHIQFGELVRSREEFGDLTAYKPVFANSSMEKQATVEIVVSNSQGEQERIMATTEHPFFVDGLGWYKASLLASGMKLIDRQGEPSLTVLSQQSTGRLETVYNIKVQDFSTYYIGHLGIWVHNADCCDFVNNYGEAEKILKSGGWVDETTGRVRYLDPFTGQRVDFPDEAKPSIEHVFPKSSFQDIPGFKQLPKDIQEALINDPMNLQPLPKHLNSSKGNKIEIGEGVGWTHYVKEGKEISSKYKKYLESIQKEIKAKVEKELIKRGLR